jgi:hypothetical protein
MRILDRSALNDIHLSTEDALQAKFKLEIPIKERVISFEFSPRVLDVSPRENDTALLGWIYMHLGQPSFYSV